MPDPATYKEAGKAMSDHSLVCKLIQDLGFTELEA